MIKNRMQDIKKNAFFIMLIGLGFLWTSTAYIAQAYRMLTMLEGAAVNLISSGAYYVCQAAGVALVAFLFAKRPAFAGGRLFPFSSTLFVVVCNAATLYIKSLNLEKAQAIFFEQFLGFSGNNSLPFSFDNQIDFSQSREERQHWGYHKCDG